MWCRCCSSAPTARHVVPSSHGFNNRAWPANDAVLAELLTLRQEHARLLGYDGWPEYDAEVKMIETGDAIDAFIEKISKAAEGAALRDRDILLARIRQDRPDAEIVDSADVSFYLETLRRERHDVDSQEVRRYFDFEKVRQGLLDVTGRLFGLSYEHVDAPDLARRCRVVRRHARGRADRADPSRPAPATRTSSAMPPSSRWPRGWPGGSCPRACWCATSRAG